MLFAITLSSYGCCKAILVDVDEYAKELSRYMHLNPVRAQMRSSPEEYRWSSYLKLHRKTQIA